jgi:hypothetical protein
MRFAVKDHPNLIRPAPYPTASIRRGAPKPYVSQKPRPFSIFETKHDRAIICPWLYVDEAWDELRWSLRSIDKFFTDKECPIYVMGNQAPKWLKPGGLVQFVKIDEYAKSREDGLWMAWQKGLQIAEKVIWTNDDIYLLKKTNWEDFEVALTEGTLDESEEAFRASGNIWRRYLGDACAELRKRGHKPVWRFATHTPYLFEREKSLEIMKEFHVPFKGAWETLYYNHHRTPHEPCGPHKVRKLPCAGSPRFLNNAGGGPDPTTQKELQRILSTKPPWEK